MTGPRALCIASIIPGVIAIFYSDPSDMMLLTLGSISMLFLFVALCWAKGHQFLGGACVVMIIAAAPFSANQTNAAMYPQLTEKAYEKMQGDVNTEASNFQKANKGKKRVELAFVDAEDKNSGAGWHYKISVSINRQAYVYVIGTLYPNGKTSIGWYKNGNRTGKCNDPGCP